MICLISFIKELSNTVHVVALPLGHPQSIFEGLNLIFKLSIPIDQLSRVVVISRVNDLHQLSQIVHLVMKALISQHELLLLLF